MTHFVEYNLGSAPAEESCAQLGQPGYEARAERELKAYKAQLERMAAAAGKTFPTTAKIVTSSYKHDFGTYYELALVYDEDDSESVDFTLWLERALPGEWDESARAELGLPPYWDESEA